MQAKDHAKMGIKVATIKKKLNIFVINYNDES